VKAELNSWLSMSLGPSSRISSQNSRSRRSKQEMFYGKMRSRHTKLLLKSDDDDLESELDALDLGSDSEKVELE
jgi:hypothetical protein